MQTDYDHHLQNYFTDMEPLLDLFKNFVSAQTMQKRLIVLHGVGGVGKSSLLRMFRLHCKKEHIPVALASGDDAKSIVDVITHWTENLSEDGVRLPSPGKTLKAYRTIQARVEEQAKRGQLPGGRVADIASKAASKTAETAGGALLGAAIGSIVPGLGTTIGGVVGGVVSGMSAEALTDWLRSFLSKPDIDLLLDPAKRLSVDFLEDLQKAAQQKRIVLLLDTFEQMSALESWVGDITQRMHPNTLVVIAGRKLPDWNRVWPGWMMDAQVEELKPMTQDIMRQLIRRYYATMRGGEPDPAQVEIIIRFARGLPMVITGAVQLWVKYGVEDFQTVKAEIVANLIDRLMEGVPDTLIPALEAAAVVRWFDQPILRAVTKQEDVRDVYNELRRFPFVRTRVEGLALHESVREMMDENLYVQDSERHSDLHERAAAYFEKRLEKASGAGMERLGLERLYHRVRANEETGIKLFQAEAEQLTRLWLVNQLRVLLKDVNSYTLTQVNSRLWRDYFNASLAFFERRYYDAENIYRSVAEDEQCEPKLKAYALCDWGTVLRKSEFFGQPGGPEKAREVAERSVQMEMPDSKLITAYGNLREVYIKSGEWDHAIAAVQKLIDRFQQNKNQVGMIEALTLAKGNYARLGDWSKAIEATESALELLKTLPSNSFLKVNLLYETPWGILWSGRYRETEMDIRECLAYVRQSGDTDRQGTILGTLAYALGLQGRFSEAQSTFAESLQRSPRHPGTLGFQGAVLTRSGNLDAAAEALQRSLVIKKEYSNVQGIPELHNWLGELAEIQNRFDLAAEHYQESLKMRSVGRHNFVAGALTGLIRAHHALGHYADLPPLLAETEQLARQYEYNDQLALLNLSLGHLAWDLNNPQASGNGFEAAFRYYRQALIFALKFNRFLLDEVLYGGDIASPVQPIVASCLKQGDRGIEMLTMLRDWWKDPANLIATYYSEMECCVEVEALARAREPGDGSKQVSVVERIDASLLAHGLKP